jgi:glutamate-ammonia-ligase adenylyltransferase
MSILRQQYRRRVFLSGALDLFHRRDIFDSLKDNTAAADAAIKAALAMAGTPDGFAVMSLGRLGTREFDLLSDADVLFVCDSGCNRTIISRTAEQLMEALTAYTRDGSVFPVDARLRPHGREGELIVTPAQLETYFKEEAKPWEALTYLKLRYVAGDRQLADRVLQSAQAGIAEIAGRTEFETELSDVRTRLERSESPQNLKTGAGGSYDIDYLAGMLQAKHQLWLVGNLLERLQWLRKQGLLPEQQCLELIESARFLRTVEHLVRLVSGRARKWLPVAEHPRRSVQKLLWTILSTSESFNPEIRLAELMRRNREAYLSYLQALKPSSM